MSLSKLLYLSCLILVFPFVGNTQDTLVLQPNAACGKDAILHGLSSQVNNNFGANRQFPAASWTFGGVTGHLRGVIDFDFSAIPAGATIVSAKLSLYAYPSSSPGFGSHSTLSGSNAAWLQRITSNWNENTVTWNNQPTTTTSNQVALAQSTSSTQNYIDTDITVLLQDIIDTSNTSFGMMLKLQNEQFYRRLNFCSSDFSDPSFHPKLVIIYQSSSPNPIPIPSINLGNDTTLCVGQSLVLDATQFNATYNWQDGSTSSVFSVSTPGTYWVSITPCSGLSYSDTIVVNYNGLNLDLGNDTTLCVGETLDLNVYFSGAIYSWQNGSPDSAFTIANSGLYWVDRTVNNCTSRDSILINFQSIDTSVIKNNFTLTAVATTGSFQWLNCNTGNPILGATSASFLPLDSGNYAVIVSQNGCSDTSSCYFMSDPSLYSRTIVLNPDGTCGKDAILHGLSSQVNNNFATSPQFTACSWTFVGSVGNVRAVIDFGLDSLPSGAAIVDAKLSLYAHPSNSGFGSHSTFSGSNSAWLQRITSSWDENTVTWNNQPSSTTSNQVALSQSNSTFQNYTDINVTELVQDMVSIPNSSFGIMIKLQNEQIYRRLNFYSSDHTNPALRPKLVITYLTSSSSVPPTSTLNLGNDTTLCVNQTLVLDATEPNALYTWQDGSTNPNFTVSTAGTYWVNVTQCNGASFSDSIVVNYSNSIIDLGNDTALCHGEVLTLNAYIQNASYNWQDGSVDSSLTVNSSGFYWVDVNNGNCLERDSIYVDFYSIDTSITQNGFTLTANANGASYQWIDCDSNTAITGANLQSFTPDSSGNYAVIISENGCLDTSSCHSINGISLLENSTSFNFNIYPNPIKHSFIVDFGNQGFKGSILILDMQGREIRKQEVFGDRKISFDFKNAANGVYILKTISSTGTITLKLVKS